MSKKKIKDQVEDALELVKQVKELIKKHDPAMYQLWEKNGFRVDPSLISSHLPDIRDVGEYLSNDTNADEEFGDDDGPLLE